MQLGLAVTKKLGKPYNVLQLLLGQLVAIRLYYRFRRICLIANSVLRTSSAISSYTTQARGIIGKYIYIYI